MKTVFLLLLVPYIVAAQYKLEWKKELDTPTNGDYQQITSLILNNGKNMCSVSNLNETVIFHFSNDSQPAETYMLPPFVSWCQVQDGNLYSKDECWLRERYWLTGQVKNEKCLEIEPGWQATSPVSQLAGGNCYVVHSLRIVKFNRAGAPVFTKTIAQSGGAQCLKVSNDKIYIYGIFGSLGGRLMQYDTLGNQKWSVSSGDVQNMVADVQGNCYTFVLGGDGQTTVVKYNPEGQVVWSQLLVNQFARNGFLSGDNLFLCGNISLNAITDKNQSCAYSIISASSGNILSQQVVDLYEDINESEKMTQIASDGKDIYIGGSHGDQYPKCFLVKLSNGISTGIKDVKSAKFFSIYPNPGNGRYTIACQNQGTGKLSVTVRNSLGQVVQKKEIACDGQKSWELDLGKQPAGHYSIEIISNGEKTVKKVVIE